MKFLTKLIFLILKLSSGCKIDNETCVCLSIDSKTLLMECLTTRIEQASFNLDFSSLNLTNNKMTINMTIQNKIFTKVGFSKKYPNQFEYIVALNLENNQIETFEENFFQEFLNL